jgi:hypothetical protein
MAAWRSIGNPSELSKVQVFSGGACNIRDQQGALLRNVERDQINEWLTQQGVIFYDPQVHPDTHGCEYDYEIHSQLEIAARAAAAVKLYEVSPRTFGGVTAMEIAVSQVRRDRPTLIFFSDGNNQTDIIPEHSKEGFPLFLPYGIKDSDDARKAHYQEFIKNANRMRRYLIRFAQELNGLTVTFGDEVFDGDVVIMPTRMHAADIFRALVNAASGKRVVVNFTGGEKSRDAHGNPVFMTPARPRKVFMDALLDQYTDEGDELRRAICQLVTINVMTRVVYTQRDAIASLGDLLRAKKILPTAPSVAAAGP